MTAVTLKYAAGAQAITLPTFWVRGLDDVDDIENLAIDTVDMSGGRQQTVTRFRRVITVRLQPSQTKTDRTWLLPFLDASDKIVSGQGEDVPVVLRDQHQVKSQWMQNFEKSRAFTMVFDEKSMRTAVPVAWGGGGGGVYPPGYEPMLDPLGQIMRDPAGNPILVPTTS